MIMDSQGSDGNTPMDVLAATAEAYCRLIDEILAHRVERKYSQLETQLARLHQAILPVQAGIGSEEPASLEQLDMTHEEWQELAERLEALLAPVTMAIWTRHNEIASAVTPSDDATRAEMLWDDLADIYRDLHNGLLRWRSGHPEASDWAAWQWRCGFEIHWGSHLFRAMTTVHEARYDLCEK